MKSDKEQSQASASDDISRRITDYLTASDDFAHELRVKALVSSVNADVVHGWTYVDPLEQKPRQFDLRVTFTNWETERNFLRMPIECKNLSADAPLIVSGTKRSEDEAFHHFIRSECRNGYDRISVCQPRGNSSLYPSGGFVGKSLLRLKPKDGKPGSELIQGRDKESDIYGVWSQALASAFDVCQEAVLAGQSKPNSPMESIVVPAVVLPDDSLWVADYNEMGRRLRGPQPTEHTTFFVNQTITLVPNNHWLRISHIHFFTLKGLRQFITPLSRSPWPEWFPSESDRYTPRIQ